jgi:hypothetical protein
MSAVYRYEVSVDDKYHTIKLAGGDPIHVGCREPGVVEFWALNNPDVGEQERVFVIVGTGHELPELTNRVWGSAFDGPFVWHLVEVTNG